MENGGILMVHTALITGASSGFGLEFAKIFASKGYNLVLCARSEDKLRKLAKALEDRYEIKALVFRQDLTAPDGARALYDFTEAEGCQVEILINNAGFGDYGRFAASNLAKQEQMIDLNVRTLTSLTHLYLPGMISRGYGRILNVASIASFLPGPMMSVYYATKAYVLSFTESISCELKGTGVTVTALCPGPTNTGFTKLAEMPQNGRIADYFRFTRPVDVARYGFKALMRGQVIAVPGVLNKIGATAGRLAPKGIARNIVYKFQQE